MIDVASLRARPVAARTLSALFHASRWFSVWCRLLYRRILSHVVLVEQSPLLAPKPGVSFRSGRLPGIQSYFPAFFAAATASFASSGAVPLLVRFSLTLSPGSCLLLAYPRLLPYSALAMPSRAARSVLDESVRATAGR